MEEPHMPQRSPGSLRNAYPIASVLEARDGENNRDFEEVSLHFVVVLEPARGQDDCLGNADTEHSALMFNQSPNNRAI